MAEVIVEVPLVDYIDFYEGREKVITNIHWRLSMVEGDFKGWSFGNIYIDISAVDAEEFMEFDDITLEDLKAWTIENLSESGQMGDLVLGMQRMIDKQDVKYNRSIGLPGNI